MFTWDDLQALSEAAENVLVGIRGHLPEVNDPKVLALEELPSLPAFVRQLEMAHDSDQSMVIGLGTELAYEEEEALDVDESVLKRWARNPNIVVLVLIDQSQGIPRLFVLRTSRAQ